MAKDRCANCTKCMENGLVRLTKKAANTTLIVGSLGTSVIASKTIHAFRLKCPVCNHPVSRHERVKTSLSRYPSNWVTLRKQVYARADHQCSNCGTTTRTLHAHHIVPISRGGTHAITNLAALCEDCHRLAHSRG